MSLAPNNFEYSPVNSDHVHEDARDYLDPSPLDHSNTRNSIDTGYSHPDNGNSFNSNSTNTHVDQIPVPPSGHKPVGYKGPPVAGWPDAPRKLGGFSIPHFIGDVVLILLPIAFLVLAICAWTLNGKELSKTGSIVESAMNLGPTVYPLAFAAIGSRCLRNIAVHLAERGTNILTLEKLLGSQSLVSAIGTAWSLRSANLLTITLLTLWVLSPIGGQSSLRLLHHTNSTSPANGTVYYSSPEAPIDLEEATWRGLIPTILTASLTTSVEVKNRPVDPWNHPKVPRLDLIEQQALQDPLSEGSWIDVDPALNHTYSSWAGINIQNLRPIEHASFEVRYNYMYLELRNISIGTSTNILDRLLTSNLAISPTLNRTSSEGPAGTSDESAREALADVSAANLFGNGVDEQSFLFRAVYKANSTVETYNMTSAYFQPTQQPIDFLYGTSYLPSTGEGESSYRLHTFTPHVITVRAQIECQADECYVSRLRYMPPEPHLVEDPCLVGQTHFLYCMTNATNTVSLYLRYFSTSLATYFAGPSVFGLWLDGVDSAYTTPRFANPDLISIQEKTNRLITLLNTYWQSCAWGYQITRSVPFEVPENPWANETDSREPGRWMNQTESTFSRSIPVYQADIGWIAGLLIISIVLLLLGLANIVISSLTIAPDLFYHASSLARENPYTNTPSGGTALDGAQRSRLLRNLKVQIADVSSEHQVGYIVVKSVSDEENFQTGRLKKGRLYW